MGKDFHSANRLPQAINADKLTAAIGSDGKSIPLEAAYEHSLQYAPSIADNTRASLSNGLAALAHSEYGQLVVASLPGLSSDSDRKIGEAYETLGDVLNAAEKGEASASLPKSLHPELSRANNWSNAMDRVELSEKSADKNGMDARTATSEASPKNMLDAGSHNTAYNKHRK